MKTELIIRALSAVALILLAIVFLPQFIEDSSFADFFNKKTEIVVPKTEDITEILYQVADRTELRFSKNDANWLLNDEKANSSEVEKLLNSFQQLKITTVAATNEVNFGQLGIGSGSARLSIQSGSNDSLVLLIGKSGTALNTFYLSLLDGKEVYLAEGSVKNLLTQSPGSFLVSEEEVGVSVAASAAATIIPQE